MKLRNLFGKSFSSACLALLTVGALNMKAQSVGVGFHLVDLPQGNSMVSNPFKSGSNLVSDLFTEVPDGFSVSKLVDGVWIANAFKKDLGDRVKVIEALTRTRNTETQTEFDRFDRKKNVKNAFALKQKNGLNKQNKLILIDDVYTTGATLDECAKALIQEGFQNVNVATLGHG